MHISRVTISVKKAQWANKHGKLVLADGTVFDGLGFGYPKTIFGELVFNTGMVGYTETLTDPSYAGQILTLTYPLIGNYGVPDPDVTDESGIPEFFESDRIQARGLVIHELSEIASHWNLKMTLDEWLYKQGVPGISGIDTRSLTKKLRTSGVMMAALAVSDSEIDVDTVKEQLSQANPYTSEQFMDTVSIKQPQIFGTEKDCVVIIDTGVKNAILRNVRNLGYKVVKLPWNATIDQVLSYNPKGVILSNGPGDPEKCPQTIQTAKQLIEKNIPTLGICLGAQIIGLAGGATTYKLKYGHRGQNKSCVNLSNNQVYVTSQNHGYGIDPNSLKNTDFDLWFTNADDDTVEGIRHKNKKIIAVQFHPEASPGPYDCKYVFEELDNLIKEGETNKK
ncbi:glutamine-hydrolyzing carbamoyl-phosphate synthase small subunit [Candidatus Nitrosotenuis uzonensis]|uniref:glutamine-hydrolyzing carbamoyl-phosphate synthase small subunit n=1 Tax=Candidatus Nitrosotenuis uzonensis TaxID=1407055 RepID=UPI00064FFCF4|nr:glutamine-hydrolyzing carbamoyl-phosphate synthase small subunit [Candidatus Nitrosotenuis uzonensis]